MRINDSMGVISAGSCQPTPLKPAEVQIKRRDITGLDDGLCEAVGLLGDGEGCDEPGTPIVGGDPTPTMDRKANSANIFQTYADIGSNMLEISQAGINGLSTSASSNLANVILEFHFDIYNPLSGLRGLVKHFYGDIVLGKPCLDPAWN
jgi:hypothetical protein